MTRQEVCSFQKKAGLVQDGIVGPKTWRALFG
ncbi:peptidoglycan-binding domain-containing protein [Croceifilum oryzae]|nr:peptidoglycan-binding domain-containing protein [Croceifilum oryzae]